MLGGTFTSQNKVLPGAYINFISAARAAAALGGRGVATMPLALDWGPDYMIFTVEQEDFLKDTVAVFGYPYSAEQMQPLRELFRHATKAYLYKLTSGGDKASNLFATARYSGTRGNALRIVIGDSIDLEGGYDVKVYMENILVDAQTVASAAELTDNEFVIWKRDAELSATAGTALTGGTNGTVTGASHQAYLDVLEPYSFNAMGVCTDDATTKALYAAYAKRMRDKVGTKFQCVLYGCDADSESVINVKNGMEIIPWLTGMEAACAVNASCTNAVYDGELSVNTSYTQMQLEKALAAGELVLHAVGTEVRILEDINSLVTVTEDKNELFQSNQTIRVLELEKLGAIEGFSEEDVVVTAGSEKRGVSVEDKVTIVGAMSQLYMTVVVQ